MKTLKKGINLGGWFSQWVVPVQKNGLERSEHYRTFITIDDIIRIADWGFDHVRLPFDYDLFEHDDKPYLYEEEGLKWLDQAVDWCLSRGLSVVLDFHRAPGQDYDREKPNMLLHDREHWLRYVAVWRMLAKRFASYGEKVIFELLNEIVDPSQYLYKALIRDGLAAIRESDKQRWVIVGGNLFNSIDSLKELELLEDPYIMYNFHYYEPVVFTHQKAYFCEDLSIYNQEIHYPGDFPELQQFLNSYPEHADKNHMYVWEHNTKNYMEKRLQAAVRFHQYTGRPLYCGEFGVIDTAPVDSACRWLSDFTRLLDSYGIPHAYWSYKDMDYGLVNIRGEVIGEKQLEAIIGG